jgi:hypothetical protein
MAACPATDIGRWPETDQGIAGRMVGRPIGMGKLPVAFSGQGRMPVASVTQQFLRTHDV